MKITKAEQEIIKQLRELLDDEFVTSGIVCESRRLIEYTDGHCIELRWHAQKPQD